MKKFTQLTAAVAILVLVAAPAFADTLFLKTGARVTGYFEGGTQRVVKFKGAVRPSVIACTLLPYDPRFDLGPSLAGALGRVALNHPHCAKFCVLGGGACSRN